MLQASANPVAARPPTATWLEKATKVPRASCDILTSVYPNKCVWASMTQPSILNVAHIPVVGQAGRGRAVCKLVIAIPDTCLPAHRLHEHVYSAMTHTAQVVIWWGRMQGLCVHVRSLRKQAVIKSAPHPCWASQTLGYVTRQTLASPDQSRIKHVIQSLQVVPDAQCCSHLSPRIVITDCFTISNERLAGPGSAEPPSIEALSFCMSTCPW